MRWCDAGSRATASASILAPYCLGRPRLPGTRGGGSSNRAVSRRTWPTTVWPPTRGGQPCYSALAILTALTLRAVFRLAYRQAEGLIGSVVGLLGLAGTVQRLGGYATSGNDECGWEGAGPNRWPKPGPSAPL